MRSIEGNSDVVFDQRSLSDLAYRDGTKCVTGFLAHAVIACSADHQVAFLERVGERKDLPKRLIVHVEAVVPHLTTSPACYSRPVRPADAKGARPCTEH